MRSLHFDFRLRLQHFQHRPERNSAIDVDQARATPPPFRVSVTRHSSPVSRHPCLADDTLIQIKVMAAGLP